MEISERGLGFELEWEERLDEAEEPEITTISSASSSESCNTMVPDEWTGEGESRVRSMVVSVFTSTFTSCEIIGLYRVSSITPSSPSLSSSESNTITDGVKVIPVSLERGATRPNDVDGKTFSHSCGNNNLNIF